MKYALRDEKSKNKFGRMEYISKRLTETQKTHTGNILSLLKLISIPKIVFIVAIYLKYFPILLIKSTEMKNLYLFVI